MPYHGQGQIELTEKGSRELSHTSAVTANSRPRATLSPDNYRQLFDTAVGNRIQNRRGDARALNFPPR